MDFDFYSLRIFCQVVKDQSFSSAAKVLGLTQPSVSQQIARMEKMIESKLFERVGHDIFLTPSGKSFHEFALGILEQGQTFAEKIHRSKITPSGHVKYAMPESCQWTPHYRKIMSQIREFPEITFEIRIQPSETTLQDLLQGSIDFGFVVGERLKPEIRFEKFADEAYSLVAVENKFFKPLEEKDFSRLRIVSYPGWEGFFKTWAESQGIWKTIKDRISAPTVHIGTLAGAIHATQEGAGVAVLPTHCIFGEIKEKRLKIASSFSRPASSPVHIARRIGEKLPKRSELVLELLKNAKQELG